ncbi:MAG: substrate-binding domain-containing protein [Spirochaetaceae bacterium]|nr:substrate-binding domain-containing protein [Spirochaetaceae bacterium]
MLLFQPGRGLGAQNAAGVNQQITEDINPQDYIPFAGSKITDLGEPANITFKHNLPRLAGATAAIPLYTAFIQALYPRGDYLNSKVLNFSPTPYAYRSLVEGYVDVIFCYAPSKEQIKLAAARNLQYRMVPICKDAFVFFVNKNNPVENITLGQIRDIYAGRITNWKDAGGNEQAIIAYQRNRESGSQTAFLGIMEDETIMEPIAEKIIWGMGDMVQRVADYRNGGGALGYSFRFFTQEMIRSDSIRLLTIDGSAPTTANIGSGGYPFTETLYAITTGGESPEVQKLLDWILSDQGQRLIEKIGYVPVR